MSPNIFLITKRKFSKVSASSATNNSVINGLSSTISLGALSVPVLSSLSFLVLIRGTFPSIFGVFWKKKRQMLRERNLPWYFFFITRKERSFHWLNEYFWYNYHLPAPPELFLDLFLLLPAFLAWFLALFLAALIALFDKYLPTHGQIGAPLAPGRNREEDWTLISPSCCPALNQVLPRCIKSAAMLIAVRM